MQYNDIKPFHRLIYFDGAFFIVKTFFVQTFFLCAVKSLNYKIIIFIWLYSYIAHRERIIKNKVYLGN